MSQPLYGEVHLAQHGRVSEDPAGSTYYEKELVTETIRPLTPSKSISEEDLENQPEWKPGYRAQFPKLGACALLIVLICAVGDTLVLYYSDGVSQVRWNKKIAPNVILSGLNSLSNICLSIVIGEG